MKRLFLIVLGVLLATPALAQVDPWNIGYEQLPRDTDLVSAGDDAIRILKHSIRERLEVGHQWRPGAGETYMGFHAEGSAWVEDRPDCGAMPIDAGQEIGRLCREQAGSSLWMADAGGGSQNQITPALSNDNGDLGASFDGYVPTNAIILWDAVGGNGDEDCDGVTTAGDCPCGYHEADEFRNLTIRGADAGGAPANANIPDLEGESCIEPGGMGTCTADPGMYDDTLTEAQMPGHDHDYDFTGNPGVNTGFVGGLPGAFTISSSSTGDDDPHYHPFRTVLFCRKN